MDFGYPGGPKVDKLAKEGKANIELPKTHFDNLDFSFSGIKTAVINLNHKNPNINKADLCASFQKTVTEILIENIKKSIDFIKNNVGTDDSVRPQNKPIKLVLAGGVSANSYIRSEFSKLEEEQDVKIYYPELKLCTDNAAMIASAARVMFEHQKFSSLDLMVKPSYDLEEESLGES